MLLERNSLHASLTEPALGSFGLLTQIMARYPQAISFAPGAPNTTFLDDLDVTRYLDLYLQHLDRRPGGDRLRSHRALYEYGPSQGLINDLVAEALRHDMQIAAPAEAIVVTVGAQEAILVTLRTLFRSATDLLAVISPCYVGLTGAARLLGIDMVPIAETADGSDVGQLEAACRAAQESGQRIRALYVAPDFTNPTGAVLDLAARHRLLELAERHDVLLIEDNAYGFTAAAEDAVPALKALDGSGHVIYIGTFAKLCLPGVRVGFVVADQRVTGTGGLLAAEIAAVKSMVTVNTSPICQAIVGGMLVEAGGSLNTLGAAKSQLYRENLAYLLATLDKLDDLPPGVTWNRPHGGFFVRMCVPFPADVAALEVSAGEHGVLWMPMSPFHLDGGGENELRLSCSYLRPPQIAEGVARLGGFLRNASSHGAVKAAITEGAA